MRVAFNLKWSVLLKRAPWMRPIVEKSNSRRKNGYEKQNTCGIDRSGVVDGRRSLLGARTERARTRPQRLRLWRAAENAGGTRSPSGRVYAKERRGLPQRWSQGKLPRSRHGPGQGRWEGYAGRHRAAQRERHLSIECSLENAKVTASSSADSGGGSRHPNSSSGTNLPCVSVPASRAV